MGLFKNLENEVKEAVEDVVNDVKTDTSKAVEAAESAPDELAEFFEAEFQKIVGVRLEDEALKAVKLITDLIDKGLDELIYLETRLKDEIDAKSAALTQVTSTIEKVQSAREQVTPTEAAANG